MEFEILFEGLVWEFGVLKRFVFVFFGRELVFKLRVSVFWVEIF